MADEEYADLDGDGYYESIVSDTNGDGNIDTVESDTDGDGYTDTIVMDTDGDGYADACHFAAGSIIGYRFECQPLLWHVAADIPGKIIGLADAPTDHPPVAGEFHRGNFCALRNEIDRKQDFSLKLGIFFR